MSAMPARNPCGSCPYRQDCPSGVWATTEYDKLNAYDRQTPFQPPGAFYCHQNNGRLCAGWVGCHDMNESLALRFLLAHDVISSVEFVALLDYATPVPLWASGAEAAAHGRAQIEAPGPKALSTIAKLTHQRELSRKDDLSRGAKRPPRSNPKREGETP